MRTFNWIALTLALSAPGLSAAQEVLPDVKVSYADLDLRTAEGSRALDRRLSRAIRQACPSAEGSADLAWKAVVRKCVAAKSAEVAEQRQQLLAATALKGGLAARSIDK